MNDCGSSTTEAQPRVNDQRLYQMLDQAEIHYHVLHHLPVFSVEESHAINAELPSGQSVKNLFLKDRKNHFWLLSIADDQKVDLKALAKVLGAKGGLSFAHADYLWQHLGVKPGSVTPYAILNSTAANTTTRQNDTQDGIVIAFFFDETLYQSTFFHAHPMRNDRSLTAKTAEIIAWLGQQGYPPQRLDFRAHPPQVIA